MRSCYDGTTIKLLTACVRMKGPDFVSRAICAFQITFCEDRYDQYVSSYYGSDIQYDRHPCLLALGEKTRAFNRVTSCVQIRMKNNACMTSMAGPSVSLRVMSIVLYEDGVVV